MRGMILIGLVAACGEQVLVDDAELCIESPSSLEGPEIDVPLDDGWRLEATARGSCHTPELQASCKVEVDGDTLLVTTGTTWKNTGPALRCEMAIISSSATCDLPPLDDGAYTIVYAGQEMPLSLPTPEAGCLQP